jgi:hypothetical protein
MPEEAVAPMEVTPVTPSEIGIWKGAFMELVGSSVSAMYIYNIIYY